MTETVRVTQEHIDAAISLRESKFYLASKSCPIAQSLNENYIEPIYSVSQSTITDNKLGIWVDLPRKARTFIEHFDSGNPVNVFEFKINLPS